MRTLGYLGPPGTFSHTAALHYAELHGYVPVCCSSLDALVHKVANRELTCSIVPVENSQGGSVVETLDLLTEVEGIWIIAELLLPVKQHLLVRPGVRLGDIERIYSHPQALSQCRGFLKKQLPDTPVVETISTASAALIVADAEAAIYAAVGSQSAAVSYGLQILLADIQDQAANTTRFVVLGKEKPVFSGEAKTSLVLAVQDAPGALCRLLNPLVQREINLTRIESRPAGSKLGDYIFFIDFEGHPGSPNVGEAIMELRINSMWLKVLGYYPSAAQVDSSIHRQTVQAIDLPSLRREIDRVDAELLSLLTSRQRLVEQVAAFKSVDTVVDKKREKEILYRVKELAEQNSIDPDMIEGIYRQIFQGAVRRQVEMLTLCQ